MEPQLKEQFKKIYVHPESLNSPLYTRVLEMFGNDKVEVSEVKPYSHLTGQLSSKDFERSKTIMWITPFKGSFFKQCPGAGGVACCNYFVLNLGLQCNMNCSYCYLQSYINTPVLTLYSNIEDALKELKIMADQHPHLPYRVGTGETTDSLSLDDLTLYSRELIQFFSQYPKWLLEFKTKSSKVDQFLDVTHAGNVSVSWSINPQYVIEKEEHQTASLKARLEAARKCVDRGFKVAFHMDPMIWHPEWKENYSELINQITSMFTPKELLSITLGALRFQPEQRHMMRERFGMQSLVLRGELFATKEGKWRYDQELRNEMFSFVRAHFKSKDPRWNVWLCMENVESWVGAYEAKPHEIKEIAPYFKNLPKPLRQ